MSDNKITLKQLQAAIKYPLSYDDWSAVIWDANKQPIAKFSKRDKSEAAIDLRDVVGNWIAERLNQGWKVIGRDGLPEVGGEYLVTGEHVETKARHTFYRYFNKPDGRFKIQSGYEVIAWMDLPQPFLAEGERG